MGVLERLGVSSEGRDLGLPEGLRGGERTYLMRCKVMVVRVLLRPMDVGWHSRGCGGHC